MPQDVKQGQTAFRKTFLPPPAVMPRSSPPSVPKAAAGQASAIQRSRGLGIGMGSGATLGLAIAGPAGMLGGALGGAVLGRAFEWWYRLNPVVTAGELRRAKQDLIPTNGPVPHVPPVNPATQILTTAKQNLRVSGGPVPHTPPVNVANQMLTLGKQNLRATPERVPFELPINRGNLTATRQNLTARTAPDRPVFVMPEPIVIPLRKQKRGKRLDQLILFESDTGGEKVRFRRKKNLVELLPGTVLCAGVHVIEFMYTSSYIKSETWETTLHIKPSIEELMLEMGFTDEGWRWELQYGTHGTLNKNFHLSVPKAGQKMPEKMDDINAIYRGIFPLGTGLNGTHMSIECKMTQDNRTNNAAYFLNGTPKYPKEYTKSEQEEFVKACRKKLRTWEPSSKEGLKAALKRL